MPVITPSEQLVLLSHQFWMATGWRMTPTAWGLLAAIVALSMSLVAMNSAHEPIVDRIPGE